MIQKKIPFDIKYRPEIEAGKYLVRTKGNEPVRIICWDRKSYFPILALIDRSSEAVYGYTKKGEFDDIAKSNLDLVLLLNPEYKEPAEEPSKPSEATVWAAMAALGATFTNYENWYQCKVTLLRHKQLRDPIEIWDRGETPYEAALGVYEQLKESAK